MLFFKKRVLFVLSFCLYLQMTSNAAHFSIPIPDLKEQTNDNADWREMGERGILFLNNLVMDTWHGPSANPRLVGAVVAIGGLFVLGHKYGHLTTKILSLDKYDVAINKKYLAAKKMVNENAVSPVVSQMPTAPFFISPFLIMIKAIGSSIEKYFLCSKPYMVGSLASGSGFYLCGHPVVAGVMAALILAKGWISQDVAELKQGQEELKEGQKEIKDQVINAQQEVKKQSEQTRRHINRVGEQVARNKEELQSDIQNVSKKIDDVSEKLAQEMQKQIAAAEKKTEENFTHLGTHIDAEFKAMKKNVVGEIAKIDEKIIDVLAKIDLVAEEAARKELIEQLSELNKKSEELKRSFLEAVQDLTSQGMLTQKSVNSLQKELEELKTQQSVDSSRIGEINQKVSAMLDRQAASDAILGNMKTVQMKIEVEVAQQNHTLENLGLSYQEIFKICTDMKSKQALFSNEFSKMTSRFEENKKESDRHVNIFFSELSTIKQDVVLVREEVKELKAENVALKETLEKFHISFEEYKQERKKKDEEQEQKRKKDKKRLKDILSGQNSLGKKVENLSEGLGRMAGVFDSKLNVIGSTLTGHLSQSALSQQKEKGPGSFLVGWWGSSDENNS